MVECVVRWGGRDGTRMVLSGDWPVFPNKIKSLLTKYVTKNFMFQWWLLSDLFCCRSTRCSWQGNLCHLWVFRQHDLYLEYREAHLHRHKVCAVCEEVGSSFNTLTQTNPLQFSQCSTSNKDLRNQPQTLNKQSDYLQLPNYDQWNYQNPFWAINIFTSWGKVLDNLSKLFICWWARD